MQVSLSISWRLLNTFSSIRFKFDSSWAKNRLPQRVQVCSNSVMHNTYFNTITSGVGYVQKNSQNKNTLSDFFLLLQMHVQNHERVQSFCFYPFRKKLKENPACYDRWASRIFFFFLSFFLCFKRLFCFINLFICICIVCGRFFFFFFLLSPVGQLVHMGHHPCLAGYCFCLFVCCVVPLYIHTTSSQLMYNIVRVAQKCTLIKWVYIYGKEINIHKFANYGKKK